MDLDTINDDLLSIADTGLKYAKNKLPDGEIELYLSQNNTITVDIQGGMVIARDSLYSGSAVRIYHNKKKSFACTSGISVENIKDAIDEALSINKNISFKDDRFHSLYNPNGKKNSNEGIIDPEILNLTSKTLGSEATKLVQDCKIDDRIISITGSRESSSGAFAVVNSNGVSSASRYTLNVAVIESVAKEGNKQKSAFNFLVTRSAKDYDISTIGVEASKEAILLLGSKNFNKSENIPVLWDSISAS